MTDEQNFERHFFTRARNKKSPFCKRRKGFFELLLMTRRMTLWIIAANCLRHRGAWRKEWDSNPRKLLASPVFKTGAFNHSAILPGCIGARSFRILYERRCSRKEGIAARRGTRRRRRAKQEREAPVS